MGPPGRYSDRDARVWRSVRPLLHTRERAWRFAANIAKLPPPCCKRRGQRGEQQPCRGPSAFCTAHGGRDFARLLMRSRNRAMSQVLIAIVDDDEPVRDATKRLVRFLGYN